MKTKDLVLLPVLFFSFGVLVACAGGSPDSSTGSAESEIAYRKLDCHELDAKQCESDPACALDVCSATCGPKNAAGDAGGDEVILLPCAVKSDACADQTTEGDCLAAGSKQGSRKGCGWDALASECFAAELQ